MDAIKPRQNVFLLVEDVSNDIPIRGGHNGFKSFCVSQKIICRAEVVWKNGGKFRVTTSHKLKSKGPVMITLLLTSNGEE